MKKILVAVAMLALSGSALAMMCPNNADKIVRRVQSHNVTAINVTYSEDQKAWADDIKSKIIAIDSKLTVNLVPETGSMICKISKA